MGNKSKIDIITEFKDIELECLGIEPVLYRSVSKYLSNNLHYTVTEKYGFQVYSKKDMKKNGNKFMLNPLKHKPIIAKIEKVWDVSSHTAYMLFNQWKRDMHIAIKLREDITKYWDYVQIPLIHEKKRNG